MPYVLPANDGVFADISAYQGLRRAMCHWRQFADFGYKREKRELHAMKPDRLYGYYCLYRLLDALYSLEFTERRDIEQPIRYFFYSIEDTYRDYENEDRCANTYQLAKRLPDGRCEQIDLYYVPVIYADRREENGISLHKLAEDGRSYIPYEERNSVWTPDYVMAIRGTGKPARTIMLDAKHISLEQIRDGATYGGQKDLLQKICRRYLDRTGCGSKYMPPSQGGVALLCLRQGEELEAGAGRPLQVRYPDRYERARRAAAAIQHRIAVASRTMPAKPLGLWRTGLVQSYRIVARHICQPCQLRRKG